MEIENKEFVSRTSLGTHYVRSKRGFFVYMDSLLLSCSVEIECEGKEKESVYSPVSQVGSGYCCKKKYIRPHVPMFFFSK